MPQPEAWFRLPSDLVKNASRLRRVMEQITAVVSTSNTRRPSAGTEPTSQCDQDPGCFFVGMITIDGVVYCMYDCNEDIVLYPAIA
jgi:hypothetical protein